MDAGLSRSERSKKGFLMCFSQYHHVVLQSSPDTDWVSYKFNSVLTLCSWRQHQIPQIKSSVS